MEETVIARFQNKDGEAIGPQVSLPLSITADQLQTLLNGHILKNEEPMPYSFFVNDEEIADSLQALAALKDKKSREDMVAIVYQPQAIFRVRCVTQCTASLPGHTEAILITSFSPDGSKLATGSGDTTIRLWDPLTQTPYHECKGHTNWVLTVRWSPDGKRLASGSMDQTVRIWDAETGACLHTLRGHKGFINAIEWEPFHQDPTCRRLVSVSKDGTARVWDTFMGLTQFSLSGHTASVTCVRWGGEGLIFTGSQDKTIKVWSTDGKLVRTLQGHAHWVNTIALNTDYPLRTGPFDHTGEMPATPEESKQKALERFLAVKGKGPEVLASGSDDFTIMTWHPNSQNKKPLQRLVGHGKVVNVVSWAPSGNFLASASFDKNIKLWSAGGKYLTTFRGHVGEVYQLCWSADSRLLVSGSKDSTMKVWDVNTKKLREDLPGHADQVYSVDWSPDGQHVASGSKDRLLKLCVHSPGLLLGLAQPYLEFLIDNRKIMVYWARNYGRSLKSLHKDQILDLRLCLPSLDRF